MSTRADWKHLALGDCFRFPVSTPEGRRDIWVGGTLLFTVLIGRIFNLGHRLEVIHHLHQGCRPDFQGFTPWGRTFLRSLPAFAAIATYLAPSVFVGAIGVWLLDGAAVAAGRIALDLAALLFLGGVFVLRGGMTYNAAYRDISYLSRPDKAFRRALGAGRIFLRIWTIALCAIGLSFLGLLVFVVGFFYTSVWAWLVVGYAFSKAILPEPADGA